MSDDLASLFAASPEQPSQDVRYRQGVVITFDRDTLENTVNVGGTTLTNLTVLSTGDVRLLIPGAVVGVLAVGTSTKTLFITGRILIPDTPEAASAVIPGSPGTTEWFAGPLANIPVGFLAAFGTAVSRTTYADLFAAIGTTWGAGDGSTTFNLPDLRNLMPIGAGSTYSVGATGGATTHSHASAGDHGHAATGDHGHAATGDHSHTNPSTNSGGDHSHGGATGTPSATVGRETGVFGAADPAHTHPIGASGTHTHGMGGTGTTGNHAHANTGSHAHANTGDHAHASATHLPPFGALIPIIRY